MYGRSSMKVFIIVISLAVASNAMYNFYKRRKNKRIITPEINDVLMFYGSKNEVQRSKCPRSMHYKSMEKLFNYLSSPKHSIDICVNVFTSIDVTNAIVKLHYRGIKIRIIIDADMAASSGSAVKQLAELGIAVCRMQSMAQMHHKFCLIDVNTSDATPFVMSGSLNWTNQAICLNWENVIVTSQKEIVQKYIIEFEKMWTLYKTDCA